jgi:aminoglycoside 6-adenylyltransferase
MLFKNMRNSTEIYSLLEKITWQDKRILALYMNGSRVNPNVMQDDFQDYDVVFVVTETSSFINDKNWINRRGVCMTKTPFFYVVVNSS